MPTRPRIEAIQSLLKIEVAATVPKKPGGNPVKSPALRVSEARMRVASTSPSTPNTHLLTCQLYPAWAPPMSDVSCAPPPGSVENGLGTKVMIGPIPGTKPLKAKNGISSGQVAGVRHGQTVS